MLVDFTFVIGYHFEPGEEVNELRWFGLDAPHLSEKWRA